MKYFDSHGSFLELTYLFLNFYIELYAHHLWSISKLIKVYIKYLEWNILTMESSYNYFTAYN